MGIVTWVVMTVFWATVGIALRSFIPNGPNKGEIQIGLALTAVCCWSIWLVAYMSQMNPLFGPQINNVTLSLMTRPHSENSPRIS